MVDQERDQDDTKEKRLFCEIGKMVFFCYDSRPAESVTGKEQTALAVHDGCVKH